MLRRILITISLVTGFTAMGAAAEPNTCPIQLQESQTQTLVVAESRDSAEQKLARAIRANRELSGLYDAALAEVKKLREQLGKAEEKKTE